MAISTIKAVKNLDFRPVKEFLGEGSLVTQLEYSDANSFESIFLKTTLTPIKNDNGIVLLINCSRVNGVQVDFELDAEFENVPKSMCLLFHNKPYKTWKWSNELKKSEQTEIQPTKFELAMIAYLEPRVGKVYEGSMFLDSSKLTEDDINTDIFRGGKWHESEPIDSFPLLNKAYLEYGTGKKSGGGFTKEYKSYAQKTTERIAVIGDIAWAIAYPDTPLPADKSNQATKQVIDLLEPLKPEQLALIELMLPKA